MASQTYTRSRRQNPSWADEYAKREWGKPAMGGLPAFYNPFAGTPKTTTEEQDANAAAQQELAADNRQKTLLYVGLAVAGYFLWESM